MREAEGWPLAENRDDWDDDWEWYPVGEPELEDSIRRSISMSPWSTRRAPDPPMTHCRSTGNNGWAVGKDRHDR